MPGAYAHLTLAALLGSPNELKGLAGLSLPQLAPLLFYSKFFELGVVSPDYPYMHISSSGAKKWADVMHYTKTGDRIKAGAALVRGLPEEEKYKSLAWLLGFTAHVIMDVTIHPVVELKVGPYAQNQTAHRVCEMHQDVFIYDQLNVGAIFSDNFLRDGIGACCKPGDPDKLDPAIRRVWDQMLKKTASTEYRKNKPDFDDWHGAFNKLVRLAGVGKFLVLSRHLLEGKALVYPAKVDATYTRALAVPWGGTMDYADIFAKTKTHVRSYWEIVVKAVLTGDDSGLAAIHNWNLDSGRDERGRLTFWE